MKNTDNNKWLASALCVLGLIAAVSSTGCQVSVAGTTLPSPYYPDDDIQYYPAGPEFKLSKEAAAMRQYQADADLLRGDN